MRKRANIPVYGLDEQLAGIYVAPFGERKSSQATYERSQPHRHDFYYCVLLEKGSLAMEAEAQSLQLAEPSLYFSYPGQVHQINSASVEQGWYFAVEPAFLEERLRDILDQFLSEVILVPLSPALAARFSALLQQLYLVQRDATQVFRQSILHSLVTAFVYQLAAAYLAVEHSALSRHPTRSVDITKAFKQLLRQQYKLLRRPAAFAARLCISTTYLNDAVRAVTGFPVTYHIQQQLVREAQRLLLHSTLGVNEIAYELGFEDAKYFIRLFRKITGTSPGAFRKES